MTAARGFALAVLGLALVFVAGATVAAAIRSDSMGPIWQNAWLPAVLVASIRWPVARRRCGRS